MRPPAPARSAKSSCAPRSPRSSACSRGRGSIACSWSIPTARARSRRSERHTARPAVEHQHPFDAVALDGLLAPFAALAPRVVIVVEDDHGSAVASSASVGDAVSGGDAATRAYPVTLDEALVGRVVVLGDSSDSALLASAGAGVASSLTALVEHVAHERHAADTA